MMCQRAKWNEKRTLKRRVPGVAAALVALGVLGALPAVQGGDLNPPSGAITSTNCTQLNEQSIDLPFTISTGGCYVLTSNLTGVAAENGIIIDADNVTLDLRGFTLTGVTNSFDGAYVTPGPHKNIEIRNGVVTGWGLDGVDAFAAENSRFENLRVHSNGSRGLRVGINSIVTGCATKSNGLAGISTSGGATVTGCTALGNTGSGITVGNGSMVSNCTSYGNEQDGIYAGAGCTVTGCSAMNNGVNGINTSYGCAVTDCAVTINTQDGIVMAENAMVARCSVRANGRDGISVGKGSTVSECVARSHVRDGIVLSEGACRLVGNLCENNGFFGDGAGIHIASGSSDNRVEDNSVINNKRGIDVDQSGNLIIRNSASNNTTNYDIIVGNHYGQIVSLPGAGFTNSNPWANFEF